MKTALPKPVTISSAQKRADFLLDRRHSPRAHVEGCATAFCLGHHNFGQIHTLRTFDYGEGGVAAYSETPIPLGCDVTVGFEARNCLAERGTVLRCQPCGEGYRVAIRFCGPS